ncbi:AraC family transcriptional regulator [Motilimonas sp. 1_MG-2023]|uniref:AraC family transcriptional regulator n=1 Tax=Motilimonas sp. 1_MG-2023 TaxID=3062672 RepID=UPI0026E476B1|nr:AraC family transcriptional regulator [Motilimonas sp. 1_MG-2023]MDO6527116.1 AraC family transcriptional regulator [Motilimonas sp. 1_MG-2023]
MKASTQQGYQQRLIKVVDYMYQHLDAPLDVNTLADVACMSPYHFHRIYRLMTGETINTTVRRLRLFLSAAELIRTQAPIAEVAKKFNYSTLEAYSRAFAQLFNQPPSEYRQQNSQGNTTPEPLSPQSWMQFQPFYDQEIHLMYPVEVTEIPLLNFIGIKHHGDYMKIGQAFDKLCMYAGSRNLFTPQTRSFGIYYQDPKTVATEDLESMACITIDDPNLVLEDEQIQHLSIPASKAAALMFKGPYAELEQPYAWLFGQWLPQSGRTLKDHPAFEEYLNNPQDTAPKDLLTRIYCLVE